MNAIISEFTVAERLLKVALNTINQIKSNTFQHVVFGICRLIDFMVPDVPEALEIKIKRERYLAKQALADTDTIMKVCNL